MCARARLLLQRQQHRSKRSVKIKSDCGLKSDELRHRSKLDVPGDVSMVEYFLYSSKHFGLHAIFEQTKNQFVGWAFSVISNWQKEFNVRENKNVCFGSIRCRREQNKQIQLMKRKRVRQRKEKPWFCVHKNIRVCIVFGKNGNVCALTHMDRHPCTHISIYIQILFLFTFLQLLGSFVEKVFEVFLWKLCVCVPLFCGFACALESVTLCVSPSFSVYTRTLAHTHTCAHIYVRILNALNASVIFSWFKVDWNWKCDSRCRAYRHTHTP